MAPPPPRHAPTTLKQAKRAYKKASAIPHLSEAELARIQRLQERDEKHERMRERERKRLLNKKKRDEKIAKEKELRKKMGLPEPGAPYIGPSQVRISQFVKGGKKVTFEQAGDQSKEEEEDQEDEEMPLSELDEEVLAALASPVSERSKTPRKPLQCLDGNRALSQDTKGRDSSPDTMVAGDDDWSSMFVSNTQIQRELSIDDDEEKEEAPESAQPQVPPSVETPAAIETDDTADLLALISTQDLEDAEDFEQSILSAFAQYPYFTEEDLRDLEMLDRPASASTHYPDFTEEDLRELEMAQRPTSASTHYPDFTEEDLRELEMSEVSASASEMRGEAQRAPTPALSAAAERVRGGSSVDPDTTSFDDDDFELSTQDLRELDA